MRNCSTEAARIALFIGMGCKSKEPKPYTGPAAPASVAEINAAKLQNATVPQAVQTAFGHDYPSASIDTIETHNTSGGDLYYQITFIQNGKGGVARYLGTGKPVPGNY